MRIIVALALMLVSLNASLPAEAELGGGGQSAHCAVGGDILELDSLVIPRQVTWVFDTNLSIVAKSVLVLGSIIGTDGIHGEPAPGICIEAEQFFVGPSGVIATGKGADGKSVIDTKESVAEPGQNGGQLKIVLADLEETASQPKFLIMAGGHLITGNGGIGGNAIASSVCDGMGILQCTAAVRVIDSDCFENPLLQEPICIPEGVGNPDIPRITEVCDLVEMRVKANLCSLEIPDPKIPELPEICNSVGSNSKTVGFPGSEECVPDVENVVQALLEIIPDPADHIPADCDSLGSDSSKNRVGGKSEICVTAADIIRLIPSICELVETDSQSRQEGEIECIPSLGQILEMIPDANQFVPRICDPTGVAGQSDAILVDGEGVRICVTTDELFDLVDVACETIENQIISKDHRGIIVLDGCVPNIQSILDHLPNPDDFIPTICDPLSGHTDSAMADSQGNEICITKEDVAAIPAEVCNEISNFANAEIRDSILSNCEPNLQAILDGLPDPNDLIPRVCNPTSDEIIRTTDGMLLNGKGDEICLTIEDATRLIAQACTEVYNVFTPQNGVVIANSGNTPLAACAPDEDTIPDLTEIVPSCETLLSANSRATRLCTSKVPECNAEIPCEALLECAVGRSPEHPAAIGGTGGNSGILDLYLPEGVQPEVGRASVLLGNGGDGGFGFAAANGIGSAQSLGGGGGSSSMYFNGLPFPVYAQNTLDGSVWNWIAASGGGQGGAAVSIGSICQLNPCASQPGYLLTHWMNCGYFIANSIACMEIPDGAGKTWAPLCEFQILGYTLVGQQGKANDEYETGSDEEAFPGEDGENTGGDAEFSFGCGIETGRQPFGCGAGVSCSTNQQEAAPTGGAPGWNGIAGAWGAASGGAGGDAYIMGGRGGDASGTGATGQPGGPGGKGGNGGWDCYGRPYDGAPGGYGGAGGGGGGGLGQGGQGGAATLIQGSGGNGAGTGGDGARGGDGGPGGASSERAVCTLSGGGDCWKWEIQRTKGGNGGCGGPRGAAGDGIGIPGQTGTNGLLGTPGTGVEKDGSIGARGSNSAVYYPASGCIT